jgi:hypothetical protein
VHDASQGLWAIAWCARRGLSYSRCRPKEQIKCSLKYKVKEKLGSKVSVRIVQPRWGPVKWAEDLTPFFAAVPTTSKLNDQLTWVGQFRAILKEKNFIGWTLCELQNSLRNRRNQRSIVLSTCSRRFRYTAHIKLKQDELMDGRSERERERKNSRREYAKKCAR